MTFNDTGDPAVSERADFSHFARNMIPNALIRKSRSYFFTLVFAFTLALGLASAAGVFLARNAPW
jgi:hypothetical protein